jgi:hypothetical protein
MKKQILRVLAVILSVAIVWWFLAHQVRKPLQIPRTNSTPQSAEQSDNNSVTSVQEQSQSNSATNNAHTNELRQYIEKLRQDSSYEWKLPINFFGKVVDDSNEPIDSADIHFEWNTIKQNDIVSGETFDVKSAESGLFDLRDKKGDSLQVSVSKQGYYSKTGYFWYSPDRGPFRPDQSNPYVFRLHKKGPGVNLITSRKGMSPDIHIPIPRSGAPVKIDLMQQAVGDTGQMIVSENKPEFKDWKQATQWSFMMEIPDGGFIGENDEFPFEAPQDGYQSVVQFDFQSGNPDWTTDIKTNFYIEFGNPPVYGRLQVQTGISYGDAILTYSINPSGSRNLEPAQ